MNVFNEVEEEAPETPSPTSAPIEPGMCGKQCAYDTDCKSQYAGAHTIRA